VNIGAQKRLRRLNRTNIMACKNRPTLMPVRKRGYREEDAMSVELM
jgi:hypothetical protein